MIEPVAYVNLEAIRHLMGALGAGEIGVHDFAAGCALATYINGKTGETSVDIPRTAKRAGICRRTASVGVANLAKAGLIRVDRRPGRSSMVAFTAQGEPMHAMHDPEANPCTGCTTPMHAMHDTHAPDAHYSYVVSENITEEQADSLFPDSTPTPAKAPRKSKATPTEADAQRVLDHYKATIKGGRGNAPDGSGSRKVFLATISKRLERHTVDDLIQSIDNFATTERVRDPSCRKGCQTYFGDKFELFRDYLPGAFEAPDPDAGLTKEELDQDDRARELAILAAQDNWENSDD